MYVGSYYNSYYSSRFGDNVKAVYGRSGGGSGSGIDLNSLYGQSSSGAANVFNKDLYQSQALQYVQGIKEGANGVKSALNALTSGSAFNRRTAVSSDTGKMTVKQTGAGYSVSGAETTVKIDQVATGQVNEGGALKSNDKVGAPEAGQKRFEVDINNRKYQLSINVTAADTNKTMQQKMADAINSRGIGVTAKVESGDEAGTSVLAIQSRNTGESASNQFSIRDLEGGAVEKMNVANVTQEAQNALYSINGGAQQSSASNTVNLGNGVTATLLEASDEELTVKSGISPDAAMEKVGALVDAYNTLYTAAVENADDPKAMRLFTQLLNTSKSSIQALTDVGLGFNDDGQMVINEEQLAKAAEDGSLEKFFRSGSSGFTGQLSSLADNVRYHPNNYVSKDLFQADLQNALYSNSGLLSQATLANSLFGGASSGLLFDFSL